MKSKFKWFSALALLAMVVGLSSCGNLINGGYYGNKTDSEVAISIEGYATGARTVLPTGFNASSDLKYVLTGESNNGGKINSLISLDSGTYYINLDKYYWNLTLTAYKSYNAETKTGTDPVLQGKASVDMRAGENTARFTMYPYGHYKVSETVPKGTVKLSGSYTGTEKDRVTGYTCGLYDIKTGFVIEGTELDKAITGETKDYKFSYSQEIDYGEYMAKVVMYEVAGSKKTLLGSWSDLVIVDPGTDSTKTDILIKLAEKPSVPANFVAELVADSENVSGYKVKFSWDRSDHSDDYILTLTEHNVDGTVTGTYELSPETLFVDYSHFYDEGSLLNVNRGITLNLETGKLYKAILKARNVVGVSEAATCTNKISAADATDTYINRFYVEYNLNGGVWLTGANVGSMNNVYEYYSYKEGAEVTLATSKAIAGEGETQEYPLIVKADKKGLLKEWVENESVTGVSKVAQGPANVTVRAMYEDNKATIVIAFANRTEIDAARMSVDSLTSENVKTVTVAFDGTKGSYSDENEFDSYSVHVFDARTGDALPMSTATTFTSLNAPVELVYVQVWARLKNSNELYTITEFVNMTK